MEDLYNKLQSYSRKNVLIVATFFLVCMTMFLFPIKFENWLLQLLILYVYFMLGFALFAVGMKDSVLLIFIPTSIMIALALRVWLEWGENSMILNFTVPNILITVLLVLGTILSGYAYAKYYIHPKIKKSQGDKL